MRLLRFDDDHPLTGGHVLAIVALFFGTVIAVNGVMAWLATGSFPGMVVKNSYVASQQYNARIAAERALAAQGIRAAVTTTGGYLHFELRDPTGRALTVSIPRGPGDKHTHDRMSRAAGGLLMEREPSGRDRV